MTMVWRCRWNWALMWVLQNQQP